MVFQSRKKCAIYHYQVVEHRHKTRVFGAITHKLQSNQNNKMKLAASLIFGKINFRENLEEEVFDANRF